MPLVVSRQGSEFFTAIKHGKQTVLPMVRYAAVCCNSFPGLHYRTANREILLNLQMGNNRNDSADPKRVLIFLAYFRCMFRLCSDHVQTMLRLFRPCSDYVLTVFNVQTMFRPCSDCSGYVLDYVQTMFRLCSVCVQTIFRLFRLFRLCSDCVQTMLRLFRLCSDCVQIFLSISIEKYLYHIFGTLRTSQQGNVLRKIYFVLFLHPIVLVTIVVSKPAL